MAIESTPPLTAIPTQNYQDMLSQAKSHSRLAVEHTNSGYGTPDPRTWNPYRPQSIVELASCNSLRFEVKSRF